MILDEIIASTRESVAARKRVRPLGELRAAAIDAPRPRGFAAVLRKPGRVTCVAEIKRRSPSAGWIRKDASAPQIAAAYEAAGAAAISVLTDHAFFGGSLDDLAAVRAAVDVPVLRKDFIIDPYQVFEARAAGADAILLIVAALSEAQLSRLYVTANQLGLDALVETHDQEEIRRAMVLGARVIGVNHRDLRNFTVDTDLAVRMRPAIHARHVVVAESGIRTAEDVRRMGEGGIDAVLVGETLMRAPDPGAALRTLLGVA